MKNILLAGAAPDTGNLGVNALCDAAVSSLKAMDESFEFGIYDFGDGVRSGTVADDIGVELIGGKNSKKIYKESSFSNLFFQKKIGFSLTNTARKIGSYDCLLDVGGGDSFTDLYGGKRFDLINYPKKISRVDKTPIILMPQTFGPFLSDKNKESARRILSYADLVYARDNNSYQFLQEIMGSEFDPGKFKLGVDMAFLLKPSCSGFEDILDLMSGKKIYGINVSGLIYNNPENSLTQYGIKINYGDVLKTFVEKVLSEDDGEVWFVPHVHAPLDHYESDLKASIDLKECIDQKLRSRVRVLDAKYNQREVKSIISKMAWFCGTRMHATIASLSSCVPTVNIAYSGKALGVFETANSESSVFDARYVNDEDMLTLLYEHWSSRLKISKELSEKIERVKFLAQAQIEEISAAINGL